MLAEAPSLAALASAAAIPDDARAVAGVLLLLLLPGFTVVRAPWTAVPFLSLGYWIASWWWLSSEGGGREAFLRASLDRKSTRLNSSH